MSAWQIRRGAHTHKDGLVVDIEVVVADRHLDLEVLADTPDDWSERALNLPINAIIEHV